MRAIPTTKPSIRGIKGPVEDSVVETPMAFRLPSLRVSSKLDKEVGRNRAKAKEKF
jgi:hypothetical protein